MTPCSPGAVLGCRLAVGFSWVLRRTGVAVSPAETIEMFQVLDLVGHRDRVVLRAALRSATAKYQHEQDAFDLAFDLFFGGGELTAETRRSAMGSPADLPASELDLVDDDPLAGYADHNPRAEEVGDLLEAPESDGDFNPHKDDDDFSLSTSERDLSVRSSGDQGSRGISYSVEVQRASSSVARELTRANSAAHAGTLDWDDVAGMLAWLQAIDPRSVYQDGPDQREELTRAQLAHLAEAVSTFVEALAEQARARSAGLSGARPEEDPRDHARLHTACREFLRRVRGAPRQRALRRGRGKLDVRRTVRRSLRTDGIPFEPVVRRHLPDRVRILVVADVSLSVRPITAFALRLAQGMHGMAHRCRVLGFVDDPVEVTDELLRCRGDDALAEVLGSGLLDLEASSDYGEVLTRLLARHRDALDKRTIVLFVGDGRCNGLAPGVEKLAELRRRVHRIGWITPEPRRYWRQATCAMEDFAEHCDAVVIARDPTEFVENMDELVAGLS